ncbi:subtilisin-like protein [Ascobolus immersus RN42]|uniref:Subtilisin-like protein n=1 Tax=Ascobolus immersus RN42 TaxID=1160509 RepID=A0A3N4IIV5_ASCIM|nr:subtilisin-like protein [Ascobolus immersus RN42]
MDGIGLPQNQPPPPPKRSERIANPFRVGQCVIIKQPKWVGYGRELDEKMFRYKQGPPIFGRSRAYEIARGPPANNPHDLAVLSVRLDGALPAETIEEHYVRMHERTVQHDGRGIRGTGIVKDNCSHIPPPPGSQNWIAYTAVYPRIMVPTILADPEVLHCGASDNTPKRPMGLMPVPTWALSAVSKDTWSQSQYDAGMINGFKVRFPPRPFDRAGLGEGNAVIVIDTFIDRSMPEFRDAHGVSRIEAGIDYYPAHTPNYTNPDPDFWDGHGTGVATLAAGLTHGVAPAATIIPVNVFREGDVGTTATDVLTALQWAENEVRQYGWVNCAVINISLGGGTEPADIQAQDFIENNLVPRGVVVVTCAGNENLAITPQAPLHPQMSDAVVVVGGMDRAGFWWGDRSTPGVDGGSNYGNVVTLSAPAEGIPIPWRGALHDSAGTSFATPLVAGLIVCLQDGFLQHAELLQILMNNHSRVPAQDIDTRILAIN